MGCLLMVGAPTRMNSRYFLIALMNAAGFRNCDIARHIGLGENRVSIILSSPLMKAQIRDLQGELRTSTVEDVMGIIEREAGNNVRVLIELRDGAQGPGADNVRRLAANDLLDRHPRFAKRTHHDEERTIRIAFGPAEIRQIIDAKALVSELPTLNEAVALSEATGS